MTTVLPYEGFQTKFHVRVHLTRRRRVPLILKCCE